MSKLAKRIGNRISEVRRKRDMTSEKLAYENDISKGYICQASRTGAIFELKTSDSNHLVQTRAK